MVCLGLLYNVLETKNVNKRLVSVLSFLRTTITLDRLGKRGYVAIFTL